jgi:transcriptional regulator with AAA-type ATPase domain
MTRAHLLGSYLKERLPAGVRDIERALQIQQEMSLQGVSKPIGRILVAQRLIDDKRLDEALCKQKQDVLLSMSLFESAPPESISVISMMAPCRIFSPGTNIFKHGDPGSSYYIIISGELLVYWTDEGGSKVPLAILKSGEGFGEMALLTGEPRMASVEAIRTTNVIELTKELFGDIILSNPRVSRSFARVMAERLSSGSLRFLEASSQAKAYKAFIDEYVHSHSPLLAGSMIHSKSLISEMRTILETNTSVLITGEYGTDKWDVARMVHLENKGRSEMILSMDARTVNLPDADREAPLWKEISQYSTLFGRAQGALPFSPEKKTGLIQMVKGGTVVIEHIEHLCPSVQESLADYIRDGTYSPLGDQNKSFGRASIIGTSRADLGKLTEEGQFSSRLLDLFSKKVLTVPPLRNRKKDMRQIVLALIEKNSGLSGKHINGMDEESYQAIMAYDWPGNILELDAVIRRAVHIARGDRICKEDLFIDPPAAVGKATFNLLKIEQIRKIFSSPYFPAAAQLTMVPFILLTICLGFFGNPSASANIAPIMVFGFWEPAFVLVTFLGARAWCGICPIGGMSSLIRRRFGLRRKVPVFIKKSGFFLVGLGIIAIFWAESAFGMLQSPRATAVLVFSIVALAAITSLVYERRTWCRYLCPLGGIAGILSTASVVELRSNYGVCTNDCKEHECYVGTSKSDGCPMFEAPFQLKSNLYCVLCGKCIKTCGNRSPMLNLRLPAYELYSSSSTDFGLVWLATILIGTQLFRGFERAGLFGAQLGGHEMWWTMSFVFVLTAAVGFTTLFSRLAGRMVFGRSPEYHQNSQLIIYALIPLAVAFEMAFHLGRLLTDLGRFPSVLWRQLGLAHEIPVMTVAPSTLKAFAVLFVLFGAVVASFILRKYVLDRAGAGTASKNYLAGWPVYFFAVLYLVLVLVP